MFPLGSVLLPGQVLPLHVFEPRYRQLVQDCVNTDPPEFGVVLIDRGSEVGGGDQRSSFGTIARMVSVAQMDDGRYAVVAVGTRRLRVRAWLPDDPYPLADVDEWPDEDPDGPASDGTPLQDRVATAHRRVRRVAALAVELGDPVGDPTAEISDDPLVATYHLSGLAPLGASDRQRLLAAPGPAARLDLLDELLDEAEEVQVFRLGQPPDDS